MKKTISAGAVALTVAGLALSAMIAGAQAIPREAGSTLEIHISDNGMALVRGAKVTSVSTTSLQAVASFGSSSVTWTVLTDSNTEVVRRYGGNSSLSEISVGDFVSFQGPLVTSASQLTVKAHIVKDWSIQTRRATFVGTISSITTSSQSFMLHTTERGDVPVNVDSSTMIKKNGTPMNFGDLQVGNKVQAGGVWNNLTTSLAADRITIEMPQSNEKTTFQGTLKTVSSTTLPTSFVLMIGDTDYTVQLALGAAVLKNSWQVTTLGNFHVGDKVRVYGSKTGATITATVVRDVSIK